MFYYIVEVDGAWRAPIAEHGNADKYAEPKKFRTLKDAKLWIVKHSYKGMSFHYEIKTMV